MKTKSINVRLLRRIQKHILEEPNRLYMENFVQYGKPGKNYVRDGDDAWEASGVIPACGTTACIAGWAVILTKGSGRLRSNTNFQQRAEKLLNLSYDDLDNHLLNMATRLFYVDFWPDKFLNLYSDAKTQKQRAKVTVARIDHFIKTKGAD